jgi:hypothetical protein
VRGIYAHTTQNEEKVSKERATKSIFDEDLVKKHSNEAVHSNDLSWAASSIRHTAFLKQAPDEQNSTLKVISKRPSRQSRIETSRHSHQDLIRKTSLSTRLMNIE